MKISIITVTKNKTFRFFSPNGGDAAVVPVGWLTEGVSFY
jgi:hypothetical protein